MTKEVGKEIGRNVSFSSVAKEEAGREWVAGEEMGREAPSSVWDRKVLGRDDDGIEEVERDGVGGVFIWETRIGSIMDSG
eukprot:CAMPEP_0184344558 /NCGR_PEP_ID=MMETSP1089-20130417/13049_1 /TAXON_ID=38269 ORGANISM="Gloeochaete wittrockiana, Strain SAG46.84" /NCGR_SAMPLE_ID=MMETSP1089 /ASSEMBLY_ACC=CAM_ASM_000445 /LENGTH=79 /DNA_ID=CAMNT_0026674445 /DNA_START=151 /DNA_END=393 /DNA_ORIENTATION=+